MGESKIPQTIQKIWHAVQTVQPCGKPQGGGGSKTPTANHWHPLPFWEAPLWPNVGPSLAKLSDFVFPQPLWKLFGEHLGDDEGEEQEGEEEEEEEEQEEE